MGALERVIERGTLGKSKNILFLRKRPKPWAWLHSTFCYLPEPRYWARREGELRHMAMA